MEYPLGARLAVDPQLRLKDDVDRAVLITRPEPLAQKDYFLRLLHPTEAVILSLMDGDRTLEEVGLLWADLTDRQPAEGLQQVSKIVDFYTSGGYARNGILIEVDDETRDRVPRYDPMEFIVHSDRVNLEDHRLRKPYMVYYLPTLFCPQHCVYCYAKTTPTMEPDLISIPRLREIFQELAGLGVEVIQLSGGDPFARKGIFEILESIVDAGMTADIPTKLGLSLRGAMRLKELGIELVQMSIDSADPPVLNHMVGVRHYHRRMSRVLDNLKRADLKVRVNCVLTPLNAASIGSLVDFLGQVGNVIRVTLTPYGRSMFCHRDALFVTAEDLAQVQAQVAPKVELYPHMKVVLGGLPAPGPKDEAEKQLRWEDRSLCTANRHGFVILPDGRVTVCEELYDHPEFIIGDLKEQSVMEMWSSPEALGLLHPDQTAVPDGPCKTCDAFAECNQFLGRCWRDVLKSYGWTKPHYPDPRCPQAPPGLRLA